jgi:hypothetical protein
LNTTSEDVLVLKIDKSHCIKWYVDAAFAVHHNKKSHTGASMTLGNGLIYSTSTKQKIYTQSSAEAELVSLDDVISKILWVKCFMEAQGWNVNQNVILRDNVSSMKLEENGKSISVKLIRHFDIKFFYISHFFKRLEVSIEYCPTEEMVTDYMTKPLTGAKFYKFKKLIMNDG